MFSMTYTLLCPVAELTIPPPAREPARRDGLWEQTCIEFFLAAGDADRYWEFNLSPAGHWNIYRFSSYRRDMQEEHAFSSLPFMVRAGDDVLNLSLSLRLDDIIPAGQGLRVGITTVLKKRDGATTYWALSHPATRPDFHWRDSFTIEL